MLRFGEGKSPSGVGRDERTNWAGVIATTAGKSLAAMPDQSNWPVMRLDKQYDPFRAVIGRCCSILSRRPPAGKTCLSLTSRGRFVQSDTNAVHKRDPS